MAAMLYHSRVAPDLFPCIVQALSEEGDARSTLAALTSTCWAFHRLAVAALWKSQSNLVNLVKTMPADLFSFEAAANQPGLAQLSFSRPLRPDDLRRFDYYAIHVLMLDLATASLASETTLLEDEDNRPGSLTRVSPQVYAVLVAYQHVRGGQLLPNLRALRWSINTDSLPLVDLPLLRFAQGFVGPNLLDLSILTVSDNYVEDNLADAVNSILPSLLSHIATVAPALTHLNIQLAWIGWDSINDLGGVLHSLRSLQGLTLWGLPTLTSPEEGLDLSGDVLERISLLPNLEKLSLHMDSLIDFSSSPQSLEFPALKSLELDSIYTENMVDIIRATRAPLLEALTLMVINGLGSSSYVDSGLASAICQRYPSLRSLIIASRSAPPSVSMESFRPYCALKKLETVVFSAWHHTSDINDEDIRLMATSWPHLRHFALRCNTSDVTLEGLKDLVSSCPNLRDLAISMRLDPQHSLLRAQMGIPVNTHVAQIDFDNSRIVIEPTTGEEHLAILAGFLHRMFTNLTSIRTRMPKPEDYWEKFTLLTRRVASLTT